MNKILLAFLLIVCPLLGAQTPYDAYLTQFSAEMTASDPTNGRWTYGGCSQPSGDTWYNCDIVARKGTHKTVLRLPTLKSMITVAFVGDSTNDFPLNVWMPDVATLSSAIGGEHCSHMQQRIAEVIALKPEAIVIGCGTNDVFYPQSPGLTDAHNAIQTAVAECQTAQIPVVLAPPPPTAHVKRFPTAPRLKVAAVAQGLRDFGTWVGNYATAPNLQFWDRYNNLLKGNDDYGPTFCYAGDGVQPVNCQQMELAGVRKAIFAGINNNGN